jgi:peptidoglycan biosynthesis/recognition FemAB-like protein
VVTTLVLDRFAAARELTSRLLNEQTARELERVERIRNVADADSAYVVALDEAGTACGLVPVYRDGDHARIGSIDTMPSWTFHGPDCPVETVEALFAAAAGEAGSRGATRISAPLLDDDLLAPVLAAARRVTPDAEPVRRVTHEGVVDVTFRSFDGYVDSLLARRRRIVRRQRRRFLESDVDVAAVSLVDACADLAPLLHQVESKYGHDRTVDECATYLATTGAAMGRYGRTLVAVHRRRPVAFTTVWDQGDGWRMRFWGCDYAAPVVRDAYLYFNLSYYEPLVRAGQAGASCVYLGTESLTVKQERGAWLRRLTTVELR